MPSALRRKSRIRLRDGRDDVEVRRQRAGPRLAQQRGPAVERRRRRGSAARPGPARAGEAERGGTRSPRTRRASIARHAAVPPRRLDVDRPPLGVRLEQPSQARVRPAPVVLRARGGSHCDAVRRGEHAPAGRRDAPELSHRLRRVVAVLEHLRAEDEVEARRPRPGAPRRAPRAPRPGSSTTSTPTYSARPLGEEGVVRLRAAADVEHAVAVAASAPAPRARPRAARARPRSASSGAGVAAPRRASRRRFARGGRYPRSFWNAANEGFFAPEAVSRPDCQPSPPRRSSRSRNQRNMSIRGWRLTIP